LDATEQGFGDDVAVIDYGNSCDGGEGLWYSYVPNKVEILLIEVSQAGEDYYPHPWAIFSGTCANLTCINDGKFDGPYSQTELGVEYFFFVGNGDANNLESINIHISV
jgi:hypothetical protein